MLIWKRAEVPDCPCSLVTVCFCAKVCARLSGRARGADFPWEASRCNNHTCTNTRSQRACVIISLRGAPTEGAQVEHPSLSVHTHTSNQHQAIKLLFQETGIRNEGLLRDSCPQRSVAFHTSPSTPTPPPPPNLISIKLLMSCWPRTSYSLK